MSAEPFWAEVEKLWEKADQVWKQADHVHQAADRVFESASMKGQPNSATHTLRFRTKNRRDRLRTAWKFIKLAAKVLYKGEAKLTLRT